MSRETKFSGTHGDREILIFPVQLTTSRIGNLTRFVHTLLYVMTYIHVCMYGYHIPVYLVAEYGPTGYSTLNLTPNATGPRMMYCQDGAW